MRGLALCLCLGNQAPYSRAPMAGGAGAPLSPACMMCLSWPSTPRLRPRSTWEQMAPASLFFNGGSSPVPAFTYSPSNPVTGSPVSFDGSASTCPASPCSYSWTDDADSSLLGTGVQMSFTFRDAGTKHVRLTITDSQSRSASVEHDVAVSPSATPIPGFTHRPSNP